LAQKQVLIGVDLGGTNIKVGLVSLEGELLVADRVPTDVPAGASAAVARTIDLARKLLKDVGLDDSAVKACGIGSPGPLDSASGCIVATPNLSGWDGAPIAGPISEAFSVPAYLEGDACAACWGEHWVGAGRGIDNMLMVTLGTGVGGALIVNGQLITGPDGTGGHIGHMVVEADGAECFCGARGCLEAYASATGTVRRFKEAVGGGASSSLKISDQLSARDIAQAAEAGDSLSRKVIERTGWYLGVVLGSLANLLNSELCCVSGGMINAGEMLFAPMRVSMREHCFAAPGERLKIVPAKLGEPAGIIGAAGCALERLSNHKRDDTAK
jgi:glucokinase